jgi:NADH-quinone oxidoreductase subunit B
MEINKLNESNDPLITQSPAPGLVNLFRVEDVLNLARANSLWPLTFGLACCAIELMAGGAARFDLDRFGFGVFRPSPRQADLMIVAGTISRKMVPCIKTLYDQMPSPKYVIALGGCATAGGPFKYPGQYGILEGIDKIIPVNVYVPGCPPRPEALIAGIMELQKQIKKGNKNIAVRYSEYEPLALSQKFQGLVDWVWVDCFKDWSLSEHDYRELKKHFKLCLVAPELQGHPPSKTEEFKNKLKQMPFDAVCTKKPEQW